MKIGVRLCLVVHGLNRNCSEGMGDGDELWGTYWPNRIFNDFGPNPEYLIP